MLRCRRVRGISLPYGGLTLIALETLHRRRSGLNGLVRGHGQFGPVVGSRRIVESRKPAKERDSLASLRPPCGLSLGECAARIRAPIEPSADAPSNQLATTTPNVTKTLFFTAQSLTQVRSTYQNVGPNLRGPNEDGHSGPS